MNLRLPDPKPHEDLKKLSQRVSRSLNLQEVVDVG